MQGAIDSARGFMNAEASERVQFTGSRNTARRSSRLPWTAGAVVVPVLIMFVVAARPRRMWVPVLGAALYMGLFYLIYTRVHGLGFSFSAFNEEAQIKRFLLMRLVEGGGLMFVTSLLAGLVSRDVGGGPRVSAGIGSIWTAAMIVYVLALNVVWFYYQQGFAWTDSLPDMGASFRALVHLLTAAGAGYAAAPSVLVTLWLAGLGVRGRSSPLAGKYR
jgi:hypothetical protein